MDIIKTNNICEISFIIPCYKSEKTISKVIDEVCFTSDRLNISNYEIICVDDCSPDNVFDELKKLANKYSCVKAIRFAKNFGQHAGMIAGIKNSCGRICVFLDDDGQCPIEKLDVLIAPLANGFDVSMASYAKKKQSLFKNIGSKFNELVVNLLVDKPKEIQMTNFIAIKRFVADELTKYNGPYPYISGLLFRSSSKITNVPMEERNRMDGGTTYSLKKLVLLWSNSFTAFSIKPLRFSTFLGISTSCIGGFLAVLTVMRKIINPSILIGWSSVISIILILGGITLFVLGVIGEYVGRIYMSLNATPQFVISEKYNFDESIDKNDK